MKLDDQGRYDTGCKCRELQEILHHTNPDCEIVRTFRRALCWRHFSIIGRTFNQILATSETFGFVLLLMQNEQFIDTCECCGWEQNEESEEKRWSGVRKEGLATMDSFLGNFFRNTREKNNTIAGNTLWLSTFCKHDVYYAGDTHSTRSSRI